MRREDVELTTDTYMMSLEPIDSLATDCQQTYPVVRKFHYPALLVLVQIEEQSRDPFSRMGVCRGMLANYEMHVCNLGPSLGVAKTASCKRR